MVKIKITDKNPKLKFKDIPVGVFFAAKINEVWNIYLKRNEDTFDSFTNLMGSGSGIYGEQLRDKELRLTLHTEINAQI